MAISSVGSYTNSYENLYTYNQTKKSETSSLVFSISFSL